VVRALVAERAQLKLERLVYFSWRDRPLQPPSHDQWPYHTGLLRTDDSAKPALLAFRDAGAGVAVTPGSPGAAPQDPAASAAPPHGRGRVDHRPTAKILGRSRRSLASVIAPGWRVRVRCRARCMVRLRLLVTGHATASHARLALAGAGTRTLRLAVRSSLRRQLAKRGRSALALEVADVSRTPLHVVTRIRLVAIA
jgi:hypothetical protein